MNMGMSMSMGTGLFQVDNMALARAYWYLIVGVLGLVLLVRAANYAQRRTRQANVILDRCGSVINTVQVATMRHVFCSVSLEALRSTVPGLGNGHRHRP